MEKLSSHFIGQATSWPLFSYSTRILRANIARFNHRHRDVCLTPRTSAHTLPEIGSATGSYDAADFQGGRHVSVSLFGFGWVGSGLGSGKDHEGFGLWRTSGCCVGGHRRYCRDLDHEDTGLLYDRWIGSQYLGRDFGRGSGSSFSAADKEGLSYFSYQGTSLTRAAELLAF